MLLQSLLQLHGGTFSDRDTRCTVETAGGNQGAPFLRNQNVPAKSKKQQMAAGAALAAKRGERSRSSLKGASKQMAKSMSEKQLEDFAATKRKNLPTRKRRRDTHAGSKSGCDRKSSSGKSRDR
jgi:Protein of unknwon function (DUF3008)